MTTTAEKPKPWTKKTQKVFVEVTLTYEKRKDQQMQEYVHKSAQIKTVHEPKIPKLNPHVRGYGVEPLERDAALVPVTLSSALKGAGWEVSSDDAATHDAVKLAESAPTPAAKAPPGPPRPDGSR